LDGTNKRTDEATLIQYIMYEWDVHKNKYATIKLKLAAIRSGMMEEGYPNPLEGKFTLDRHLKGIKVLHGATNAKEPLPMEAFKNILEQTRGAPLMVRAAALACAAGSLWLLRISEMAGRDKNYMEPYILRRCDVTFYNKGKLSAWNQPDVDAVELYIRGSKTDRSKQGCLRMQEASRPNSVPGQVQGGMVRTDGRLGHTVQRDSVFGPQRTRRIGMGCPDERRGHLAREGRRGGLWIGHRVGGHSQLTDLRGQGAIAGWSRP
jgi:hypothetical protein